MGSDSESRITASSQLCGCVVYVWWFGLPLCLELLCNLVDQGVQLKPLNSDSVLRFESGFLEPLSGSGCATSGSGVHRFRVPGLRVQGLGV